MTNDVQNWALFMAWKTAKTTSALCPKNKPEVALSSAIFRSKFDLSNIRGAGEHHIHFSFLMNLVLHEEFQMHSNSKASTSIYPTYLNNTKYWTKSFKKCIFFNVRWISEAGWMAIIDFFLILGLFNVRIPAMTGRQRAMRRGMCKYCSP